MKKIRASGPNSIDEKLAFLGFKGPRWGGSFFAFLKDYPWDQWAGLIFNETLGVSPRVYTP